MDDVFQFRDKLIQEYARFSRSFVQIAAPDIRNKVEEEYANGRYWPEPLVQINPHYQRSGTIRELVDAGTLHPGCLGIFQTGKTEGTPTPLSLYTHQKVALHIAQQRKSYVVTTGTGSGKSLSFFIPIIDRILKARESDSTARTRAIVIYPMNALANSQLEELDKFLHGYDDLDRPITVARYTGQESTAERERIAKCAPDILLTNFMMLEYILTRYTETDRQVIEHCAGLEFLVLDELHTYRGRQGADVALLVRRLRERLNADRLVCIGTSATMSSAASESERNRVVAEVASKLFGTRITEHEVIGETLERVTDANRDIDAIRHHLLAAVRCEQYAWPDYQAFQNDPLAIWVELTLGVTIPDDTSPIRRARPIALKEAGQRLASDAGCSPDEAQSALARFLLAANDVRTPQGRPPFAFKLHQFISGPGMVLTTLEPRDVRHITLDAQRFAPGRQEENVQLYPVHFCRDCGHEYMPVWHLPDKGRFFPRELDGSTIDDETAQRGLLCIRTPGLNYTRPEDLPEDWIDVSGDTPKIRPNYRNAVPDLVAVTPQGEGTLCAGKLTAFSQAQPESEEPQGQKGQAFWFIPGKLRFCLSCGRNYPAVGKDANRLSSLSGEGRSSATTMITLAALEYLFKLPDPQPGQPDPRKLLAFTDNRQDAALQAGHFNDFIFLLTLRGGLIGALKHNKGILTEDTLTAEVFNALGFDRPEDSVRAEYLRDPGLRGPNLRTAQADLRFILGYRLIRDLRRGWRFNNPNLEQLKLLDIRYRDLQAFCEDESCFADFNELRDLPPAQRVELYEVLFNRMRTELCIESRYLDDIEQDKIITRSYASLNDRWAIAQDERLETGRYLVLENYLASKRKRRYDLISGSERSGLVRSIKRKLSSGPDHLRDRSSKWRGEKWAALVRDMLRAAENYGYVQRQPIDKSLFGWRLNASLIDWCLAPALPEEQPGQPNAYFRALYESTAKLLGTISHPLFEFEAQEHTAQVDAQTRQVLEQRFRYSQKDQDEWKSHNRAPLERLPLMFCSPTMELGVDISALNTVYLRNVPPTPANYAQRSGRAGRSGQQALVVTYCAALSPHDQWFFHRAQDMVHGVVRAPTLDLANRDLVQSHLQAVWLACTRHSLDDSIAELLDMNAPGKPPKPELMAALRAPDAQARAQLGAARVIEQLAGELDDSTWFTPDYVQNVIADAPQAFSRALERWRTLFEATQEQLKMAQSISSSHAVTEQERKSAERRASDAQQQFNLLLKPGNSQNSDFYTYRYLASQGFLPGYNFPRLPLMAWVPGGGRKSATSANDHGAMVSRPRFLGLSEFGPRSLIYHQGRMFRVVRAKLSASNRSHISGSVTLTTLASLVCGRCGYGHASDPASQQAPVDICESCGTPLSEDNWVRELYRIETVETRATQRISTDDEERQHQGFELQTTYRFLPGPDGRIQKREASIQIESPDEQTEELGTLTYAPAAQIWRINRGWRRRRFKQQLGFLINPLTGRWSPEESPDGDDTDNADDEKDGKEDKIPPQRIVPYVEDFRNLLIFTPAQELDPEAMATVQAALKRGIEMVFQIEESELVAEPLPKADARRAILFYEAAEGGAGVLTRLASNPADLATVARAALKVIHYHEPASGIWTLEGLAQLEKTTVDGQRPCEAGCYQCLLSYYNQPEHQHINRRNQQALALLVALANARVAPAPATIPEPVSSPLTGTAPNGTPPTDNLTEAWLTALQHGGYRQPDACNVPVSDGKAMAAAQYKAARTLVFLAAMDEEVRNSLLDRGWQILLFTDPARWHEQFATHPEVFGTPIKE